MDRAEVAAVRFVPVVVLGLIAGASRVEAAPPVASFGSLVTGNGFGFQVFDAGSNRIKQFLERPYRFVKANPANPDGDGLVRRQLAYDTYFGVEVDGAAAWLGDRAPTTVEYVAQSNVIHSVVTVGEIRTDSYYFAPFGYDGNALVMLLEVTNTGATAHDVTGYALHNFKLGDAPNPDAPDANNEAIAWNAASGTATEVGPGGGVMIYAPIGGADVSSCATDVYTTVAAGGGLTATPTCSGTDRVNAFARDLGAVPAGESRWWGVAVLFDAGGDVAATRAAWTAWLDGRAADAVLDDALAEWDAWRAPPPAGLSTDETAAWRQAEAVLRMGQIRESYQETPRRKNHGMILASLPPGGWHVGWVRDATYAIAALARGGHPDEARLALDFFLDADAGRYASFFQDVPYRISTVRYFGDGQEEADYSGQPTRNLEIDGWGLFLWAARQYLDAAGDASWLDATTRKGDTVYDAIKVGVADALAANLEPSGMAIADASIWEVHWGNRQHFLYTTAAAARGFCDMATIARRAGHLDDVARYQDLHARAVAAIEDRFTDDAGVLASSVERLAQGVYRDGATVEAINWSLIAPDDPIAGATLDAMAALITSVGGYKRIEGSTDPYDIDEWVFVDLRIAAALRRAGDTARADELIAAVTAQAAVNHDLMPELYNTRSEAGAIGAYAGSMPMVGFGAGAYQLALLDRGGPLEAADCGSADPEDPPDAGVGPDGGAPIDGDGDGGCGCRASSGPAPAWLLVVTLVALRRRRR